MKPIKARRLEVRRGQAGRLAAFTLVELLVVIGIIALLISILLPALNRARAAANQVACASNMRQFGMAAVQYANDYKGYLPLFGETYDLNGPEETMWWNTIAPYLGLQAATAVGYYPNQTQSMEIMQKIRPCPENRELVFVGPHYTSWIVTPGQPDAPFLWGRRSVSMPILGVKMTQIRRSTEIFLFLETRSPYYYMPSLAGWPPNLDLDLDGVADTNSGMSWLPYNGGMPKVHNNKSNVVFVDGHVQLVDFKTWIDPENGHWINR